MNTHVPTLYLMVGYPGSGKTTTSTYIHELTGAVHIWADHERKVMFGTPTHTYEESKKLYYHLNQQTAELLRSRKSVIFDTNFNFYKDRVHLRQIASEEQADCKLIWLTTDREVARHRATADSYNKPTRVFGNMHIDDFDRIANNLEPPRPEEHPLIIDGADLSKEKVAALIGYDLYTQ